MRSEYFCYLCTERGSRTLSSSAMQSIVANVYDNTVMLVITELDAFGSIFRVECVRCRTCVLYSPASFPHPVPTCPQCRPKRVASHPQPHRTSKQASGAESLDAEPVFDVQQLLGPRDDILSVVARRLGNVLLTQGERRCAEKENRPLCF